MNITELRALVKRATPGPWFIGNACDDQTCAVIQSATCANVCEFNAQYHKRYDPDQDLIVALRNHAEALLEVAAYAQCCCDYSPDTIAGVEAMHALRDALEKLKEVKG